MLIGITDVEVLLQMASQFESLIGHGYSNSSHKVPEEPLVRCLACKDSQWEGNYQDLISHFKQNHPHSICWSGDKVSTSLTLSDAWAERPIFSYLRIAAEILFVCEDVLVAVETKHRIDFNKVWQYFF